MSLSRGGEELLAPRSEDADARKVVGQEGGSTHDESDNGVEGEHLDEMSSEKCW